MIAFKIEFIIILMIEDRKWESTNLSDMTVKWLKKNETELVRQSNSIRKYAS